ncbi:hypothetical protein CR513_51544, partial [Mucuna pruriens]
MERTLDDIQIRGNVMDNFNLQVIQCNGRKMIDFGSDARNLRMYLPPSFFYIHIVVHLVKEIILCSLMYLVKRYMKILKSYLCKEFNRPKAFIVERYIAKEVIEFCLDYMLVVECFRDTRGVIVKNKGREEVFQAHLYILNNTEEVQSYLSSY